MNLLFVVSEIPQVDLLNFDVEVAKPLVNVAHVLLLDVLELVEGPLDVSVQNRHFELALIYIEFSVDNGEGAPASDNVFVGVLRAQVDDLKDYDVGRRERVLWRKHVVELVSIEVHGLLLGWVVPENI